MSKGLVHEMVLQSARRFPEKPAIILDDNAWTYANFAERIGILAAALREVGVRKGDRVVLLLSNKQEFLAATYAVMAAGAIAVPCGEHTALGSLRSTILDCTPSCILSSTQEKEFYPYLKGQNDYRVMFIEDYLPDSFDHQRPMSFSEIEAMIPTVPTLSEEDGALIMYTSGTTGKKKGVLLTHRNLIQATKNINAFMGIDAEVREYIGVPLTHSFGFGRTRCVLFVGGTVVVSGGVVNPAVIAKSMHVNRCNGLAMVPAGLALFLGRFEHMLKDVGPHIKHIEIGSSPMLLNHKLKLLKLFPEARICMHYGLTEASRSTFLEFRSESSFLESVGKPSPNCSIKIINEEGDRLGDRVIGEIAVKGKHVTVGYWNDSELTKQHFTEDGWFKTGDYGFIDQDGYVHLLGRRDDIINMGGVKISPLELEEAVAGLYPEMEFCVVGIPDPGGILGRVPVVCYVPRNGGYPSLQLHEERLRRRIDVNKMPRYRYRFDEFPKTENGKIIRWEVQRRLNKNVKEHPETLLPAFSIDEQFSAQDEGERVWQELEGNTSFNERKIS